MGMGGHIGTGVALRLDTDPRVQMLGIDMEPPRRRIKRAVFHRVASGDLSRRKRLLVDFDPEVIVHAGIYEPHARSNPRDAEVRTRAASRSVVGAAPDCPSLRKLVLRSGTDVYGRRRGGSGPICEDALIRPTSRFGRILADAEASAEQLLECRPDVQLTVLRFAPIVGPYIPSPLGRYLRLPVVPVAALSEGPLQLCHIHDAHTAFALAVRSDAQGAYNISGNGTIKGSQAARIGKRVFLPVFGPGWKLARAATALLGAPLPEHSAEALTRGQIVDNSAAGRDLGFVATFSTRECIKDLYNWAAVVRLGVDHNSCNGVDSVT